MSIIIAFIIILLTVLCYIIISEKFKKSYGIIASTLLFIILVSIILIWYFYPSYLTFEDTKTFEINVVPPSGEYLKLNETEKEELINLIEKTEFKRGRVEYIPYSAKITDIIVEGGRVNRNGRERVLVFFNLWNDEPYGKASINSELYYFESREWKLLTNKYINKLNKYINKYIETNQ